MTYLEAINWLFKRIPNYQNEGAKAYKPGLDRISSFLDKISNPQNQLKIIHVAGTNGKGSVSHAIAAALQANKYSVGIFSSPHLFEFTERVKINGISMDRGSVTRFINENKEDFINFNLSFFEITAAMAFNYFHEKKVDFAVIEVGLGGRLDATNVVSPFVSVITKIGIDHTQFLGNTLKEIALEKAGIIKSNVPVICGDHNLDVLDIIRTTSANKNVPLYSTNKNLKIESSLPGNFQLSNLQTALKTIEVLLQLGVELDKKQIKNGFKNIQESTAFFGRFQQISSKPDIIVDAAHNAQGVDALLSDVAKKGYSNVHIIYGCSNDKDLTPIFQVLSKHIFNFYFAEFSNERSYKSDDFLKIAFEEKQKITSFSNVNQAYSQISKKCSTNDVMVICGSFFLLADFNKFEQYVNRKTF